MSSGTSMLRPGVASAATLQRARQRIAWVDDEDLGELERKSLPGVAALSLLTWGGGHIYVGDFWRGAGLIVALAGWLTLASVLPGGLAGAMFVLAGALSAVASVSKGRDVNRFLRVRDELALRQGPDPSAYRLLTAAAAVDPSLASALPASVAAPSAPPGSHAGVIERLRKLSHLHRAGVLSEIELRDRKLDVLQDAAPASRAELDDLLYELLPLVDEAVLDAEDIELVKQIGGE